MISRTATAPLDRLKVYLIAQTGPTNHAVTALKEGDAVQASKQVARPLVDACRTLWRTGGISSFFAGLWDRSFEAFDMHADVNRKRS